MAYRNQDGRIMIDEVAAAVDIKRAAEAADILRRAESQLSSLIAEAEQYKGNSISAMIEKATLLRKRTQDLIRNLEEVQSYTRRVVAHYKAIDAKCSALL